MPLRFMEERPSRMLWIEALLMEVHRRAVDPWVLDRVTRLLVAERWLAWARA